MYKFKSGMKLVDLLLRIQFNTDVFTEFMKLSRQEFFDIWTLLDKPNFNYGLNNTEGMVELCIKQDLIEGGEPNPKEIEVVIENKTRGTQRIMGTLDDSFDIVLRSKQNSKDSYSILTLNKQGLIRYIKPHCIEMSSTFNNNIPKDFWSINDSKVRLIS